MTEQTTNHQGIDRFSSILFSQEWFNEKTLSLFRAFIWLSVGGLYAVSDLIRTRTVTIAPSLALLWGIGILSIHFLILRKKYKSYYPLLFSLIDVIVYSAGRYFTYHQLSSMGSSLAEHQFYTIPLGFLVIISMHVLRFSWKNTLITVILSCISILAIGAAFDKLDMMSFVDIAFVLCSGTIFMYSTGKFSRLIPKVIERQMLSRFLPSQLLEAISSNPDAIKPGGELKLVTMLFADIRDFTTISHNLTAPEVVRLLNEYFQEMVEEIDHYDGVLDKFLGDGIFVSFGGDFSKDTTDPAVKAVLCAKGMIRRLHKLNEVRSLRNESPLRIGIGIHTGLVVRGNIGSSRRMDFTHIGETVKITNFIENLTKQYFPILISESTFSNIREDDSLKATPLDRKFKISEHMEEIQLYSVEVEQESPM